MNKELKGKLETALEVAGLDKGLLAFVNIAKEEEIQGVVDNLNKLKTPTPSTEEILKQKEIQSEIDRRISEAKKSWEKGNPEPPNPPAPANGEMTPEVIAAIIAKAQEPLLEKLNGFEQSRTREGKMTQARNALAESKIPEKNRDFYLENFDPNSEQSISEWVKSREERHENYVQSLLDSGSIATGPPARIGEVDVSDEEAMKIAERMNK